MPITCVGQATDEKRHLLRFWVDTDANNRPIAPTFAPRSSVQAQGGFKVWGAKITGSRLIDHKESLHFDHTSMALHFTIIIIIITCLSKP